MIPASRRQEVELVAPAVLEVGESTLESLCGIHIYKNLYVDMSSYVFSPQSCRLILEAQPSARFVIPIASPSLREPLAALARRILGGSGSGGDGPFVLWDDESAIAMMAADIAITKTGSASMELAFLEVA